MAEGLEMIVAVHGLDPSMEIKVKHLREIQREITGLDKVCGGQEVKLPIVLFLPDGAITLFDMYIPNLNNPYKNGIRCDSIDEALVKHKTAAQSKGYERGVPLILISEFRRYPIRKFKGVIMDYTRVYNSANPLTDDTRDYFGKFENQSKLSAIYSEFALIYKTILRELRIVSHPECYNLALEAAVKEGHFGETFIKGIRAMRSEVETHLKLNKSETEKFYGDTYEPLENVTKLKDDLKQRIEKTEKDTAIYRVLGECYKKLDQLSKNKDLNDIPKISQSFKI